MWSKTFVLALALLAKGATAQDCAAQIANSSPNPSALAAPTGRIRIDFYYDNWPSETSWSLSRVTASGNTVIDDHPRGTLNSLPAGLTPYSYDLAPGSYMQDVDDSFRDGICCRYGQGKIDIFREGPGGDTLLASSDGRYGGGVQLTFDVAPPASSGVATSAALARDYICSNTDANDPHLLQRFALATLAKSVTDRLSILSDLFPGGDECNSQFITCNSAGAVTQINIEDQWLTTDLPAELSLLTELTIFDANRNHLHGQVPSSFSALTNLQRFDVEEGGLTGHAFPEDFCNLASLTDFRADCPSSVCCIRFISNANFCNYQHRRTLRGLLNADCGNNVGGPNIGLAPPPQDVGECPGQLQTVTASDTLSGVNQLQELTLTTSATTSTGNACVRGLLTVPDYVGPMNIGIVIDISGSTYSTSFRGGSTVGDVNGDGRSNSLLDAQIVALTMFFESIATTPGMTNDNINIGLVTFSTEATYLGQFLPRDPNNSTAVNPQLLTTLHGLRKVRYTNFDDALDKAVDYFDAAPPNRRNVLFFLSDGKPNVCGDGDRENRGSGSCTTDRYISSSRSRAGATKFDSELAALDAHNVIRHSIGVGSGSNVAANSGLDKIDNTPDPVTGQKAVKVTELDALVGILTANPVAGEVQTFTISVNGVSYNGINAQDSLLSGPLGYSFGNFVLGGLDPTASNSIAATCVIGYNGEQITIEATATVAGTGRRKLRKGTTHRSL